MYYAEFLLVVCLLPVVGVESFVQVFDCCIFVLHGVVGGEWNDSVCKRGFSVYGCFLILWVFCVLIGLGN